jgi:hypothetical protein
MKKGSKVTIAVVLVIAVIGTVAVFIPKMRLAYYSAQASKCYDSEDYTGASLIGPKR